MLLEVKGKKRDKDGSKWEYIKTWVKAVSQDEENGVWHFAVSQDETGQKVDKIIDELMNERE